MRPLRNARRFFPRFEKQQLFPEKDNFSLKRTVSIVPGDTNWAWRNPFRCLAGCSFLFLGFLFAFKCGIAFSRNVPAISLARELLPLATARLVAKQLLNIKMLSEGDVDLISHSLPLLPGLKSISLSPSFTDYWPSTFHPLVISLSSFSSEWSG